jgi:hypothetical protein
LSDKANKALLEIMVEASKSVKDVANNENTETIAKTWREMNDANGVSYGLKERNLDIINQI